ncbi:hypothetical protein KUCAC02_032827, partial [Chaenocephalus aceratus]
MKTLTSRIHHVPCSRYSAGIPGMAAAALRVAKNPRQKIIKRVIGLEGDFI